MYFDAIFSRKFSVWLQSSVRHYINPKAIRKNLRKSRAPNGKFKYVPTKEQVSKDIDSLEESPKGFIEMKNPFEREKKKCILCTLNITPDYKNVKLLSQFQSSFTGRIYGRHITGLCQKQQKLLEIEIAKARSSGLMAYYLKEIEFLKDPKLFDPSKPIRPHPY